MSGSAATLATPRDELTMTLENESDVPLSGNASGYEFYRWHDGDWSLILAKSGDLALELVEIAPGESRQWRVRVNNADLGPAVPPGQTDDEREFAFRFPPGVYAFGFEVERGEAGFGPSETGTDDRDGHLYAREFEVTGDELGLEPSDAVDETLRRGDALVVRTATEREYDHDRRVSLVADRLPAARDRPARLSRFELYNPGREMVRDYDRTYVDSHVTALLRDGLAHVDGSESQIRVETIDTATPPLGLGPLQSVTVVYEGTVWRLTSAEGWSGERE